MSKIINNVYDEEYEIEGMFDADGKCLGAWCLNDANWRSEYMNPFMGALGYDIKRSYDETLIAILRKRFGLN